MGGQSLYSVVVARILVGAVLSSVDARFLVHPDFLDGGCTKETRKRPLDSFMKERIVLGDYRFCHHFF
jgi:hypothetical protein